MTYSTNDNTIFDDVFRTMAEKMSPFLIPLINEVFGTSYDKGTPIHHDSETHITLLGKRSTDSCFRIEPHYQYHLECQSNPDNTIVVRFFEYDVAIALLELRKTDSMYHVRFPRSAVLYLRHTSNTPDTETLMLEFADGGSYAYRIPVIKTQNYSLDDIFEKELFILLPFYLLRYEKKLKEIDKCKEEQEQLLSDVQRIRQWLSSKIEITEHPTQFNINTLILRIANYLMPNAPNTRKGVDDIMGGKVLELFSEQVERETTERVTARVTQQVTERMSALIRKLLAEGRTEDIARATSDIEYLEELYQKYHL